MNVYFFDQSDRAQSDIHLGLYEIVLLILILPTLGLNTLAALIQVNSSFATQPAYQRIVIDCLDDSDETLKRKVSTCVYLFILLIN